MHLFCVLFERKRRENRYLHLQRIKKRGMRFVRIPADEVCAVKGVRKFRLDKVAPLSFPVMRPAREFAEELLLRAHPAVMVNQRLSIPSAHSVLFFSFYCN